MAAPKNWTATRSAMTRDMMLRALVIERNELLEGHLVPLASSVRVLALHENLLKRFQHTRFEKSSYILLQHNALSCHLPLKLQDNVYPNKTVCAVGNQLQQPRPDWLSSFDHNGIFWSSGREGRSVLVRVVSVVAMLGSVVCSKKHGWHKSLRALTSWPRNPGCRYLLKVCASQLAYVGCQAVMCILFIMVLVDWRFYECPRMLTLASACHIDSTQIQWAVVFLWVHSSLHWRCRQDRWMPDTWMTDRRASGASSARQLRVWTVWIFIMLPMSSLAMLNMTSMCVPDFLQVGEFWLKLVNLGIGACQGLISSFVIPRLASAFTPTKHFYTSMASIFTAVCFPASCVVYFDHECLGRWAAWWGPCCRNKRQQFDLHERLSTEVGGSATTFELMKADELCTPRLGQSSSICTMVTVLKMQDLLLAKVIMSSMLVPLRDIARETHTKDAAMVIVKLGLPIQLIMLFSGMLPLLMPILWLAWVCLMLLVAFAKPRRMVNEALAGVLLTQISAAGLVLSAMLHAAFTSGNSLAVVVQSACAVLILRAPSHSRDTEELKSS